MLDDIVHVPESDGGRPSHQDLPQVFLSYSRRDGEAAQAIGDNLPHHGWRAWVDATGIPETAEWWQEIVDAIRESEAFAFLITPDSASSPECAKELEQAATMGKRIVPVLLHEPSAIPDLIKPIEWVDCRTIVGGDGRAARLAAALNVDLDWLKQHTWLLRRAHEWRSRNGDRGSLLRGEDLALAEQWLLRANEDRDPQPMPEQKTFLVASRRSAIRTQRRRFIAVAVALAVSLVLTTIAVGLRQAELRQQHIATSRELAADAISQLEVDPELSLILARDAVRAHTPPTAAAIEALRVAIAESHVRQRLRGIGYKPNDVAVAGPDGPFSGDIAVAGANGTVRLFDIQTGQAVGDPLFSGDNVDVTSVDFDPTGSMLLATMNTNNESVARVWSSPTDDQPDEIDAFSSSGRILSGAAGSDGSVVLGGTNGAVRWASGRIERIESDEARVTAVARSDEATAILFDTDSETGIAQFIGASGKHVRLTQGGTPVTAIAFSHEGKLLVTGRSDGSTSLWKVSGSEVTQIDTVRGHVGAVTAVGFSADDAMFASGGADGTATVRETSSGRQLAILRGHAAPITSLGFDESTSRLAPSGSLVTGAEDHTVRIWDVSSGEESVLSDFGLQVAQAAIGGDDSLAIAALRPGTATVWRLDAHLSVSESKVIPLGIGNLRAVAISPKLEPDGSALAILVGDEIAAYRIRPTGTGNGIELEPAAFDTRGLPLRVNAVAFDPAGRYLAIGGSQGAVLRVDLGTGARTSHDEPGRVATVAVARDGEVAIGGQHGRLVLWSGESGALAEPIGNGKLPGRVLALAFSPANPKFLASSSTDSRAEVWDTRSDAQPRLLLGHLGNVDALSFEADGERLATASEDGTVRVWSRTGHLVAVIPLHAGAANSVSFRGDDELFVSTILGHVAIYVCELCAVGTTTEALLRQASRQITRSLDCNEQLVFLGKCATPEPKPSAAPSSG